MFGHNNRVPDARLQLLRTLPIFAEVSDEQLGAFDAQLDETTIKAGETLMTEGRTGREAVLIVDGTAEVLRGDTVIAHLGHGDIVGEMALLEDHARSATVRAVTDLTVLVMNPLQFQSLLNDAHTSEWIAGQVDRRAHRAGEDPVPTPTQTGAP
jgi:CRP-like cAMP-binding protein